MRVISAWQPHAELIARELKQYETRGWEINYRGPIAIHASKKKYRPDMVSQDCRNQMLFDGVDSYWFSYGSILCVVDIVSCEPTEQVVTKLSLREQLYGDYSAGRFAWRLDNVRRFPKPIELAGHQGIFHWRDGERLLAEVA
jgi:hypothetical protein